MVIVARAFAKTHVKEPTENERKQPRKISFKYIMIAMNKCIMNRFRFGFSTQITIKLTHPYSMCS